MIRRVASLLIPAAFVLAGCATAPAPPATLEPGRAATEFGVRSLRDPVLHAFVAENLGYDPAETWDFEALSWAAFYFHPSLDLARAQWATARTAEAVVAQRPNPTITLTPGTNLTREAGLSPWMPALSLDFLLNTASKRDRQAAAARHDAEVARLGIFSMAWQVRSELRRALSDATIAARRETQLHNQAEAQRALLALLQQRLEAGSIAAPDVSMARTGLLRAESAAADAHAQALTARVRVATALGLPVSALDGIVLPPAPAAPALSGDTLAAMRQEALRSRPDILAALSKYHSAHAALELEIARQAPDFHLGPGYQWDQGAYKWTLAFTVELPLFHRNEAAIAAATARRAEAAAQFNLTQAQAIAAIDQAIAAEQAAQFQIGHVRQLRDETQQQVTRVEQRVAAGAGDQVELQTARLDVATADLALLDALNTAAIAAGQLEDALQVPLPHFAAVATLPIIPGRSHE